MKTSLEALIPTKSQIFVNRTAQEREKFVYDDFNSDSEYNFADPLNAINYNDNYYGANDVMLKVNNTVKSCDVYNPCKHGQCFTNSTTGDISCKCDHGK